jgi:hypothetical protein
MRDRRAPPGKRAAPALACLVLSATAAASPVHGHAFQVESDPPGRAVLFRSDSVISLAFKADFRALRTEDRYEDAQPRPLRIRFGEGDGGSSVEGTVRTRGHFRLAPENCRFPPLRIDLDAGAGITTPFRGLEKIKVVTPCRGGPFEQLVVSEYLVYRIFNLLTDHSLGARLARVRFVDTSERDDTFEAPAVLLEDAEALATRLSGSEIELEEGQVVNPHRLDPWHSALVEVAQYMIGSTDWSLEVLHNFILVDQPSLARQVAVPYDFDFTGLVDAPYATPAADLGTRSVTERVFRGVCRDREQYAAAIERINSQREPIIALFAESEWLDNRTRARTTDYLRDFFHMTRNVDQSVRFFLSVCRA